jgi:hypothetical protein
MLITLKFICLFIAIWFSLINISRIMHKCDVVAINFIIQAIGITGFVILQWLI